VCPAPDAVENDYAHYGTLACLAAHVPVLSGRLRPGSGPKDGDQRGARGSMRAIGLAGVQLRSRSSRPTGRARWLAGCSG